MAPYSRAAEAVRAIRSRLEHTDSSSTSTIATEQHFNFAGKGKGKAKGKAKGRPWTIKVVCLSDKDAKTVPTGGAEREQLAQAGLGEKKIIIEDVECSVREFRDALTKEFPKLSGCGGYDLLRCIPNSKSLEAMNSAVTHSPKLLKSIIGGGRVFIRPIQQNLSMDVDEELKCAHEEVSIMKMFVMPYLFAFVE